MTEDRGVRQARERFCEARRDPDHLVRWLAWLDLRSLLEGWDRLDAIEDMAAKMLILEAARWKAGWRPPTTYAAAMADARRRRREGRLRLSRGGA